MQNLFGRILICTLVFFMAAGQAAAFDLQIGHLDFGPPAAEVTGRNHSDNSGLGAMISIPLGFSASGKPAASTLNGQNLAKFTEQDAKDSLIVIMLFGVAIAAGALSVSAASN
jgi:hypothetical protein